MQRELLQGRFDLTTDQSALHLDTSKLVQHIALASHCTVSAVTTIAAGLPPLASPPSRRAPEHDTTDT